MPTSAAYCEPGSLGHFVDVPHGVTVTYTSSDGTFDIRDGLSQGLFGGPSFVLLPVEDDTGGAVVVSIAILIEILADAA